MDIILLIIIGMTLFLCIIAYYCGYRNGYAKQDKASYEIAEKEKYDFVSGQFIECRKSFNEFKEDNSYWFEYVGDDTYIGRSDNILNQKFHITPRQLYCLFTQEHCPKENNVNEETNAPTEYGKYVDECLNDASKHFFSEGEDKYNVADLFYAGVRCGKSWFEKQLKLSMKVYTKDNTVFIIAKRVGYFDKYTNSYRFTDWEYDYDHPYYFRDEAYEALMYKRNHSDGNTEYKCDERI